MLTIIHYQVKNIDPAWPVPKEAPKERVAPASVKPHKIHVNPNFVGKVIKVFFIIICRASFINYPYSSGHNCRR